MNKKIDLKGLIPYGNELRVLLNSQHISEGDINALLKRKGIFCGNGTKIASVPLLSATLLSSDDYAELIDGSVSRSLKPKKKIASLELTQKGIDFKEPLKKLFDTTFDPFINIPNIKVTKKPTWVFDQKSAKLTYVIKRLDFSEDFLNRELEFEGEISLKHTKDGLSIESVSTHTSAETEQINKSIGVAIARVLKQSDVTKSDVEDKIAFNSFNDEERVKFFKRLTSGKKNLLTLGNVNQLVVSRETSLSLQLPSDPQISWMNKIVTRLMIDGEKLDKLFLISDEKYYAYYFIDDMNITYQYDFKNICGTVKVLFYFSSLSKNRKGFDVNSELTFEIVRISHQNKPNFSAQQGVKRKISEVIIELIKGEYERILNERKSK